MSSMEQFKADVAKLSTVNGKQIKKLTDFAKLNKPDSDFIVDAIISSINEVSLEPS